MVSPQRRQSAVFTMTGVIATPSTLAPLASERQPAATHRRARVSGPPRPKADCWEEARLRLRADVIPAVQPVTQSALSPARWRPFVPKAAAAGGTFPWFVRPRASSGAPHHSCCTSNESLRRINKGCRPLRNRGPSSGRQTRRKSCSWSSGETKPPKTNPAPRARQ